MIPFAVSSFGCAAAGSFQTIQDIHFGDTFQLGIPGERLLKAVPTTLDKLSNSIVADVQLRARDDPISQDATSTPHIRGETTLSLLADCKAVCFLRYYMHLSDRAEKKILAQTV